jgi:hypothetical protein
MSKLPSRVLSSPTELWELHSSQVSIFWDIQCVVVMRDMQTIVAVRAPNILIIGSFARHVWHLNLRVRYYSKILAYRHCRKNVGYCVFLWIRFCRFSPRKHKVTTQTYILHQRTLLDWYPVSHLSRGCTGGPFLADRVAGPSSSLLTCVWLRVQRPTISVLILSWLCDS